jgi:hypothetical protein
MALGFDLDVLVACTQPATSFYMSPFYRPDATPQDDPELLVSTTLSSMGLASPCSASSSSSSLGACVPANLRPTLAQILIPHHASLDLLPLPRFRDRVIMMSAAMPHLFNLLEFKGDVYCRGAMAVRSSGTPSTGAAADTCQPWDPGNWDVAPWFVRKWSMAVDKDSELGSFASVGRIIS